MATPKYVTGKVTDASGAARPRTRITARLSEPCVVAGTQEVVPTDVALRAADDGTWTLQLYANDDLSPAPTYYSIFRDGETTPMVVVVPQTADTGGHVGSVGDPMRVSLILAAAPSPSPLAALDSLVLHKATREVVAGDKIFDGGALLTREMYHDLAADAVLDTWIIATGSCTAGSPIYTAPGPIFSAADVGKLADLFTYPFAGVGITGTQQCTILGFIDSTHVTLSVNANHAAAGNATLVYGTDDTAAVQTWWDRLGGIHTHNGGGRSTLAGALRPVQTGVAFVTSTITTAARQSLSFRGGTGTLWASARLGATHLLNIDTVQGFTLRDLHMGASLGFMGRFLTANFAGGDTGPTVRLEGCTTFSPNDDADWAVFIHGNVVMLDRCSFNTNNKIYNKCLWVSASISGCSATNCEIVGRNYTNCQQMDYIGCSPMGPIRAANNSSNDGTGTVDQGRVVNIISCYQYSTSHGGIDYPNVESVVANAAGTDVAGGNMPILNFKGGFHVFGAGATATQSAISGNFTASQGSTGVNVDGTVFIQSSGSGATTVNLVKSTGGAPPVRFRAAAGNILAQVTTARIFSAAAGLGECVVEDYMPSGQATQWQHPALATSSALGSLWFLVSGTILRNSLATAMRMMISPNGAAITRCEVSSDGVTFNDLWNDGTIDGSHQPFEITLAAGVYYRFTWTGPQPTATLMAC